MGYESLVSRDPETAPAIGLGVHATYMQRVVLVPRIRDPKRPMPFGRVRGHDGDRVWVEWLDTPRRIVTSVRAQFLAPACGVCRARFLDADETHRHDVDGGARTLTPRGVRDDPLTPSRWPWPSATGTAALLGITTPHDGPHTLTAGWGTSGATVAELAAQSTAAARAQASADDLAAASLLMARVWRRLR